MSATMSTTETESNRPIPMTGPSATTLATKGTLLLRHMLLRDIPAYERIHDAAFAHSLDALFYPRGKTAADSDHDRRCLQNSLTRDAHFISRLMCIDSSVPPLASDLASLSPQDRAAAQSEGRIVGLSVWKVRAHDRTQEELDEEIRQRDEDGPSPSIDEEVMAAFAGKISGGKKKYLGGRRHVLLHLLATDPEYHRKGIGGLHMAWGVAEADRLQCIGYLESSVEGKGLYERWGFEEVERLGFDARKYGMEKELVFDIMIRPAKES